ncbi:MAG: hypothetical protein KKA19_01205 [Candidatus Margulisbacteria bacterium]|nr:hypothetical protein [Candidatus Margulisiibacteriota bacterium]
MKIRLRRGGILMKMKTIALVIVAILTVVALNVGCGTTSKVSSVRYSTGAL